MTRTLPAPRLLGKLSLFAADIKLSHSIFALPFALLSMFLAARSSPTHLPALGQVALIIVCMVSARTVAMASNRLLDALLDAANPRTAARAIPSGRVPRRFYGAMFAAMAALFVAATGLFDYFYKNPWPAFLSLPVLAFVAAYPLLKRFTSLCHFYLGAALALAPLCAWVAMSGPLTATPFLIGLAVFTWTAGFDVIYACQDRDSDIRTGVFSVPARTSIASALWVSRGAHAVCALALLAVGWSSPYLGTIYYAGVGSAIGLLIIEQSLVGPSDLSKVNIAFFTANGIISIVVGAMGIIDTLAGAGRWW